MTNIAVIPARGGSKRIPRKNIRLFSGQPMIAYSIKAALESELFDRVIVSTDDEEIADVSRDYGAEIPFFRPFELSDDHTGTTAVMAHAVNWVCKKGPVPDTLCCIYATAPLIQPQDLKKGLDILKAGNWQYVFSATKVGVPFLRSFKKNEDNGLEMFFPEYFKTRSQDLSEAMYDAGQFYWGQPRAWIDELKIFDHWSTIIELPRWRVQDIDTLDDWEHAELISRLMVKKESTLS